MGNWFKIISKACEAFRSGSSKMTSFGKHSSSFTSQTLHDIATRNDQIKMNKIMNNIQVASILAYIQEGKLDFIDEDINNVFATQFPEVNGSHNLRRMRIPLTLAAFISPICLFMPKKLYNIQVACESILNIWHSLGNQKPTNIKNIKDEIWDLLAKLVESEDFETDITSPKLEI
jgi:hypothetical protein